MRKILILMGRYLPGHKDGGPLRTIINLTDALGDEYEFYIACLDRDHGDFEPYADIIYNEWNTVGKAKVWYVKPGGFSCKLIERLAKDVDLIYTCGFYGDYGYKTLILNKLGKLYGKPVAVAAMGTFSSGALAHKSLKKKIFITGCKALGLFEKIKWSVTSEIELADVKINIGKNAECIIAEDLPRTSIPGIKPYKKYEKKLKIAFLSRIAPQKNLLGTIRCLNMLEKEVDFSIFGPEEDKEYWARCQEELKKLPDNIHWEYRGDVPSESVQKTLQMYDAFLLPTKGENYGHVIFEALSVGCIPIISDQTPWAIIADKKAGYVLPLTEDMKAFTEALNELIEMSYEQRRKMSESAVKIAEEKVAQSKKETGYRTIFG